MTHDAQEVVEESGALSAPEKQETGGRLIWMDLFRGLAIVAVVLIHILARFLRHSTSGSHTWECIAIVHRASHYAVPGFLLLSALLNAASLIRRPSIARFMRTRLQGILWPYLIWSGIFLGYRAGLAGEHITPSVALNALLRGTAYTHLYFLWVLIQLLVILPVLLPALRSRPPFWFGALAAIALTAAFYVVNKRLVYQVPDLVRSVLDYIPPVALGLWMGSQFQRLDTILRRGWPAAVALTILGAAIYFPLAIRGDLLHQPVDTRLYQVGWWCYTASASFLVMVIAWVWEKQRWRRQELELLGRYSLQIYLVHPFVLIGLDALRLFDRGWGLLPVFVIYLSLALVAPMLMGALLQSARVSLLLFGR